MVQALFEHNLLFFVEVGPVPVVQVVCFLLLFLVVVLVVNLHFLLRAEHLLDLSDGLLTDG